jgi:hypothetical protein
MKKVWLVGILYFHFAIDTVCRTEGHCSRFPSRNPVFLFTKWEKGELRGTERGGRGLFFSFQAKFSRIEAREAVITTYLD